MEGIFSLVSSNLAIMYIGIAMFSLSYGANMVFSTYHNITIIGDIFDKKKMLNGFIKMLVFLLGMTLLSVSITTLPVFAVRAGITIPEKFIDVFDSAVILYTFISSSVKYIAEAREKMNNIMNGK